MMNNFIKSFLLLSASILLLLPSCISQGNNPNSKNKKDNDNISNFEVVFPMNEYLTTKDTTPYPVLAQEKFQHINTSSFANVMDYGAAGNGSKADDNAIARAFAACKDGSGVIFPKGKTFLIQNLIRVPLNKNITIYAYGATFKMANNTGYNAIAFEGNENGYNNQVIWLGGLFDGNKNQQSWPGSPTGNNNWMRTQGNYGLLTIRRAKFALVKDISLINTVYDGVELFECELGVIADSKASGGVNLNYSKLRSTNGKGHQSTYFKCTRRNSQVVYFINLDCKEGSIGVQYSTNFVSDSSLAVINNCHFYNQGQDAIHFESCRKIFIYNSTIGADNSADYHADVHISNSCELAAIKNSQFKNGRIDFRNATSLQLGVVENCQFEAYSLNDNAPASIKSFIHNATHVENCSFTGKTKGEQVTAKYVVASSFRNFDAAVIASLVYKCEFNNGKTAIKNFDKANISESKFINTNNSSSPNKSTMAESALKNILSKSIAVVNERKKSLGYIVR